MKKSILHRHEWSVVLLTGFFPAQQFRSCECGERETLLVDTDTHEKKWVSGNFSTETGNTIYIFAASEESYLGECQRIANIVLRDDIVYKWAKNSEVFGEISKERNPFLFLASDWFELELIHDNRFRILMSTRRLA
jgi:hypothetical protein